MTIEVRANLSPYFLCSNDYRNGLKIYEIQIEKDAV